MSDFNLRDYFALGGFLVSALALMVLTSRFFSLRRRDISTRAFLLGAPLWFITPKKYFAKASTPWRLWLIWVAVALILVVLADVIPDLLDRLRR